MPFNGHLFIGFDRVATEHRFRAIDPARREALPGEFAIATAEHVARACDIAAEAFDPFRAAPLEQRARFLERCAVNIEELGDELLERAGAESGLPRGRLEGERGRTVNQLRLFARVVRQGDWLDLRIDPAQPERKPLPRSDLRLRKVSLGPVAVFGASNFPLAFSAGGGDVASALAAGCPVVVKGHPAHPGTSEMVAGALVDAVKSAGFPPGVYSHLSGPGNELGAALVRNPQIQAVAFTGSRQGGLALVNLAAQRPVPIPVYAEMSSVNPVIILPAALKARYGDLAVSFVGSLTMGVGQFCTNPGLVLLIESPETERFIKAASAALASVSGAPMLTEGIHRSYEQGVSRLSEIAAVKCHGRGRGDPAREGVGALFEVRGDQFLQDEVLAQEVFGPTSLVIRCADAAELALIVSKLEGQLTATLQIDPEDFPLAKSLLPLLERRAGRIIANGWPTGVEVAPAMVHGGPFPATSTAWTTSVGTLSIDRFLRPVCYQDFPAALIPDELQDNTTGFERLYDGQHGVA